MTITIANKALLLDLVEWIAARPRPYTEVMDAWRTSCPRLPIWEDALDLAFVSRHYDANGIAMVRVTDAGQSFIDAGRPEPGVGSV